MTDVAPYFVKATYELEGVGGLVFEHKPSNTFQFISCIPVHKLPVISSSRCYLKLRHGPCTSQLSKLLLSKYSLTILPLGSNVNIYCMACVQARPDYFDMNLRNDAQNPMAALASSKLFALPKSMKLTQWYEN